MPHLLKYVAKLQRRHFKDRPDWQVVNDDIPIGTEYRILGIKTDIIIRRTDTNEERKVLCYLVTRNGDDKPGFIPVDVFND